MTAPQTDKITASVKCLRSSVATRTTISGAVVVRSARTGVKKDNRVELFVVCSFSRRDRDALAAHLLPRFLHSVVRLPAPTKVTVLHAPSIRYGQSARPYQLYTLYRSCGHKRVNSLCSRLVRGRVEVEARVYIIISNSNSNSNYNY